MTEEGRKRAAPLFQALASIPLLERDRERLPIVGKILGHGARLVGQVAAFRAELEAAILRGATSEEIDAMFAARRELASEALDELRATVKSWPAKPAPVVTVKALPRTGKR